MEVTLEISGTDLNEDEQAGEHFNDDFEETVDHKSRKKVKERALCTMCAKTFRNYWSLRRHETSVHL